MDGRVWGLIDHVTFTNTYSGVFVSGDNNLAWALTIAAGTANALFIEDSSFILNASSVSVVDAEVYVQEGASVVSRYNIFDSTAFTAPGFLTLMYNHHGNQDYVTTCPLTTHFRGQPIFESYNNTARAYRLGGGQFEGYRGGSVIVHDETFETTITGEETIYLSEEEQWQGAFFSPLRTVWPSQDQVTNSFFWNNTYNGTPMTTAALGGVGAVLAIRSNSSTMVQEDRDFFMHAPAATGGKSTYTGTRNGGSDATPTTGDCGSMTFSGSGANAYYPYTTYTYPHPLQGLSGGRPPATSRPAVIDRPGVLDRPAAPSRPAVP